MNLKQSCLLLLLSPVLTHAATVTNNITGVGPDGSTRPYFCIQNDSDFSYSLAPGASVDGNAYSGNDYYVGGSLRFNGCADTDPYLGYAGFNVSAQGNNSFSNYSPFEGVHVSYANPGIDSHGSITGEITYTPIDPNFSWLSSAPKVNPTWDFAGINLSGLEFSKMLDPVVVPNLSAADASTTMSDLQDTQAFVQAGVNTVRVPVRWGYLQLEGPGQGPLYSDYFDSYVKPLLESLSSEKIHTIVDLHAYMRYSYFGQGYAGCSGAEGSQCPDGELVLDPAAYVDVWTKLYQAMKADPKIDMNYIMVDIVNEPTGIPDDKVFTLQAAVINSLRSQGFAGDILVEGNAWTGLHSWTTPWTSSDGKTSYSNAELFSRANFEKAGITDLSHILINVHQYLDSDFSGSHEQCMPDLSTTGEHGYNLDAFVDYLTQNQLKAIVTEFGVGNDEATCRPALDNFLQYMQDHSAKNSDSGFAGWTIWSTGHGWGDYSLRVTPDSSSFKMQVLSQYL